MPLSSLILVPLAVILERNFQANKFNQKVTQVTVRNSFFLNLSLPQEQIRNVTKVIQLTKI